MKEERRMIWDFLKSKQFNFVFSVLIGLGLAAILRPACKGDKCVVMKAPQLNEIKNSTFQLGSKCYQFTAETVDCPTQGVVEAFSISRA
jgi:hypothetical protein